MLRNLELDKAKQLQSLNLKRKEKILNAETSIEAFL